MPLNDPIQSLLRRKDGSLWSVSPDNSVYEAVALMAEKQIGALPVMQAGQLVGLLSERDYARKIILMGRSSKETRVGEIMTSPAVTVTPHDTVTHCMHVMTELRIRHLPVIQNGEVVGILSIGDVVNWTIQRHEETIQQLHEYISGSYPA